MNRLVLTLALSAAFAGGVLGGCGAGRVSDSDVEPNTSPTETCRDTGEATECWLALTHEQPSGDGP